MKRLIAKYTSIILAILGFIFSTIGYILEEYMVLPHLWVWVLSAIILTSCGYLYGKLIERLHLGAYTDSLSGLRNRRFLYQRLEEEMERVSRSGTDLSIIMIDLDKFKQMNDNYGHLTGDLVIKSLAKVMSKNKRATDTVARWGGDEFVILLPGTSLDGAKSVASRLQKAITHIKSNPKFSISIGINSTNKKVDINQFVKQADNGVYEEKARKKGLETSRFTAV